jgi:hypothetical protein
MLGSRVSLARSLKHILHRQRHSREPRQQRHRALHHHSGRRWWANRPSTEQFAVPLYKSVALKRRKRLAVFVYLVSPDANYGSAIGLPEPLDEPGMMQEMTIENGPMVC